MNNRFYAPERAGAGGQADADRLCRAAGRSPLEVMSNYQEEVAGKGGRPCSIAATRHAAATIGAASTRAAADRTC